MADVPALPAKPSSGTLTEDPLRNEKLNGRVLDKDDSPAIPPSMEDPETEYITGIALYGVLFGVTLVVFLIMLDQTIIVTVRNTSISALQRLTSDRPSHASPAISILSKTLAGMAVHSCSPCMLHIPYISHSFSMLIEIAQGLHAAHLWEDISILQFKGPQYPVTNHINLTKSQYCFLTALALFELGSLICAVSKTSDTLIVGRAVAGMGAAGLIGGFLTILAASAPLAKRPGKHFPTTR